MLKTFRTLLLLAVLPFFGACSGFMTQGDIAWKLYPDPRETLVKAGEQEIVFAIQPKHKQGFTLDFGDGSIPHEVDASEVFCISENNNCKPVHIRHLYEQGQAYTPSITLNNNGEFQKYPKDPDELKIFIARNEVKTTQELKEAALNNMLGQVIDEVLASVISDCDQTCEEPKLSISILKNANFEYAEGKQAEQDFQMVTNIMNSLVKRNIEQATDETNKILLVEKHPQALVRLAQESVVEQDSATGRVRGNDKYLEHLEYSLATFHVSPEKPFYYSAKMEGINDEVAEKLSERAVINQTQKTSLSEKIKEKFSLSDEPENSSKGETKQDTKTKETGENKSNILRNYEKKRPMLLAQFKTATHLLVIDMLKPLEVRITPKQYYSKYYNTPVAMREATLEVNARLLNRGGGIVWMDNVKGIATDKLAAASQDLNTIEETVLPIDLPEEEELIQTGVKKCYFFGLICPK